MAAHDNQPETEPTRDGADEQQTLHSDPDDSPTAQDEDDQPLLTTDQEAQQDESVINPENT